MNTQPMPLDAIAQAQGGLDAYRLGTPAEVAAMLRRLREGEVLLNLNAPHGSVYTTTLWTTDAVRGVLSFAADPRDPQVQALLESDDAVVVGYLDNIKIQFDIGDLVLVHGGHASALNASYPRELFRFQCRNSFRVRPMPRQAPVAHFRHPTMPDMPLALRMLDVSLGGCALLLPDGVPAFAAGVLINGVQIELDLNTRFEAALRLQHATAMQSDAHGMRLGFETVNLSQAAERLLQRYIDQAQRWRRFIALD